MFCSPRGPKERGDTEDVICPCGLAESHLLTETGVERNNGKIWCEEDANKGRLLEATLSDEKSVLMLHPGRLQPF